MIWRITFGTVRELPLELPLEDELSFCRDACAGYDSMGYACAGFTKETQTDYCTLVGRGAGLKQAAESDFYRRKFRRPRRGIFLIRGW